MKKIRSFLLISFIAILIGVTELSANSVGPQPVTPTPITQGALFASPIGSGTSCLELTPCSIWTAVGKAVSGNVVYLREGTYPIATSLRFFNQGTSQAPVIFEGYPNETAILDGSQHAKGTNVGIYVYGKFIQIRNIEINSMPLQGIMIQGNDNLIEGVRSHHNGLSGIQVFSPYNEYPYGAYGSRNVIRNSTVHDNSGVGVFTGDFSNGLFSNGIAISSGADNRVENCLAYRNSANGIDAFKATDTYIGYSIAHSNGLGDGAGNGLKASGLSPNARTIIDHSVSYSNKANGVTLRESPNAQFLNNTTWGNDQGFVLNADTVASNNIATETKIKFGTGIESNNSWQRSVGTFLSIDPNSPYFLIPATGGGYDDIGAYANTTIPNPLPDLIITSFSYLNGIFTVTVKNQGLSTIPTGTIIGVGYFVDGKGKTWGNSLDSLAPGQSVVMGTKGGSYIIPSGTHEIMAYIDDMNRIIEIDETNNKLTIQVTIP